MLALKFLLLAVIAAGCELTAHLVASNMLHQSFEARLSFKYLLWAPTHRWVALLGFGLGLAKPSTFTQTGKSEHEHEPKSK